MKLNRFFAHSWKALVLCLLAVMGFSCSKTTEKIGNGLLPDSDHMAAFFTDTLELICHSETIDSMTTRGMTSFLLGSMVDPVMGRTNAGFCTQLHLSAPNQRFGTNPVVDSVVLQLAISGYYGDTLALQTVHVYELADTLSGQELYYQCSDVETMPTDLANGYTFQPHPTTSGLVIGDDTLTHSVIRIPLDHSFGQRLMDADTSFYDSADAFKEYVHGIKVCCEAVSTGGCISYLYPTNNDVTVLQLYYHDAAAEETAARRYNYYITSADTYFNQYDHDYTLGAPAFVQQVVEQDTTLGQEVLYLQSMAGIRSVIRFPNLKQWGDTLEHAHLLINEAKLILPASSQVDDSSCYTPPTSCALLSINPDGSTSLLPDYYEGSSYYGGSYASGTGIVSFRIAEYLQQVMQGKTESQGLYLSITGAAFNSQRWIIAGPDAAEDNRMRCEIKYSIVGE